MTQVKILKAGLPWPIGSSPIIDDNLATRLIGEGKAEFLDQAVAVEVVKKSK